jgi:hypothetical protein
MKTRTLTHTLAICATLMGFTSCKKQALIDAGSPCSVELALEEVYPEMMAQATGDEGSEEGEDVIRPCILPLQDPDANLDINVELQNFTESQEEKMKEALKRLKIVINSVEFKERVLNHTFNGEKTFHENNGLTNEEVYQTLMDGAEELLPEIDEEMDLDITMYYKRSSTVGYTYPNTTRIWVNSRFFNGYSYGQVAANATHEWTHKLGYGHSKYNNSSRPYTVPYGIGTIIEDLVDGM